MTNARHTRFYPKHKYIYNIDNAFVVFQPYHLYRRCATEACSCRTAFAECGDQTLDARVDTKRGSDKRSEEVDEVEGVEVPADLETADPATESTIAVVVGAGDWVEDFFWSHGVLLDLEGERKDSRECVGELQNADGANKSRDEGELRNGRADDPRNNPVDRDERHPEEFAGLGGKRGKWRNSWKTST